MENHETYTYGSRTVVYSNGATMTEPLVAVLDRVTGHGIKIGDKKKPNSFSYTALRDDRYQGTQTRYVNGVFDYKETGVMQGQGLRGRVSWTNMTNYHYNRALDRLNDLARGTLDLSVSAAEMHQTRDMLVKLSAVDVAFEALRNSIRNKDPVKAYDDLKRGIKRDPKKVAKRAANGSWNGLIGGLRGLGSAWLTWQYGIRPLLSDLYDSVDELYRHGVPGLLQIKGSSSEKLSKPLEVSKLYSSDKRNFAESTGKQGVKFVLQMMDSGGFDLTRWASLNPASLAWELLPLSFVADWIYDIGGMLRSLETSLLHGSRFVSGYTTRLYALECTSYSVENINVSNGGRTFTARDASSHFKYIEFTRSVLGSYPMPTLPTFKVSLGSEQLLTTASLMAQKFL